MTIGQKIYQALLERIQKGSLSDALPSQSELMAEFKVSSGTVKLAIARLKQERLIYGMQGKGIFIASGQINHSQESRQKVYVRLTVELLRHRFYVSFLGELERLLIQAGMSLEFNLHPRNDFSKGITLFLEHCLSDEELQLYKSSLPAGKLISINSQYPGIPAVLCDNFHGGELVMQELYARGHRKIGVLAKDIQVPDSFFTDRMNGVYAFATEHPDVTLCVIDKEEEGINCDAATIEGAVQLLRQRHPDVTAVFSFTDTMAVEALYNFGKSVAVVGYGNSSFCSFQHPALASVDEQADKLASQTFEVIMAQRKGKKPQGKYYIPATLIQRTSLDIQAKKGKK